MSSDLKLDLNYFENILVYQSLTNTSYLADIIEYIKLDYFNNNDIRVVFKVIKEYYKQYHKAPNASELVQYLVSDEQKESFKKVIQTSKTLDRNISYDEIIINTERFLGERAVYTTMMDIAGDFKNLDITNVYQRFHDACNIRLYKDLGLDFYRDVDKLVDYLGKPNPTISTGFTWLDQKLGGGYLEEGKALYIFVGQPNVGKSIFLGNAATTIASQGKNVLLVSLEMSEMMYATRLASKLTKIPIAELRNRKDEIKHILEGKERGKIIIKEFPPSTLSPEQLENYYKTVVDSGIKIDVMVLDYINLLRGKASAQSYEKIKEIAEQVRAIAVKHGISVLSATQKNRCLSLDTIVDEKTRGKCELRTIKIGDELLTQNGVYNTVKYVYPVEKQKTYKITTKSGKVIRCSANHIFPTNTVMKSIDMGLAVGDKLLIKDSNTYTI